VPIMGIRNTVLESTPLQERFTPYKEAERR